MDTQRNQLVMLTEQHQQEARALWQAWQAGLLPTMPRYAPIEADSIPVKPRDRKRKRARRSYRDFCR